MHLIFILRCLNINNDKSFLSVDTVFGNYIIYGTLALKIYEGGYQVFDL